MDLVNELKRFGYDKKELVLELLKLYMAKKIALRRYKDGLTNNTRYTTPESLKVFLVGLNENYSTFNINSMFMDISNYVSEFEKSLTGDFTIRYSKELGNLHVYGYGIRPKKEVLSEDPVLVYDIITVFKNNIQIL